MPAAPWLPCSDKGFVAAAPASAQDAGTNANVGASWILGEGSFGAMYDWRQAASDTAEQRSEITGFYSFAAGAANKLQLYGTIGLSDGSPGWGVGMSYARAF